MVTAPSAASADPAAPEPFDFRGTTAHVRDEMGVVAALHQTFPEVVASGLRGVLRADVEVSEPVVELASWHDYVRSLADVTVLATVAAPPLPEPLVSEIDARFALALVERLLGGPGALPPLRRPSALEASLLSDLFAPVMDGVRAVLGPLEQVEPELRQLTFDPSFLEVARPTDLVVVVGVVVTVSHAHGRATGMLTVCYPQATLDEVVARHPSLRVPDRAEPDGLLDAALPEVTMDLAVRLRETDVHALDVATLAPGDVLRLDHRVDEPVLGLLEGRPHLLGRLGRRDGNLAIEVGAVLGAPPHDDRQEPA